MRGVGVQHLPRHQPTLHRQLHHFVEQLLIHIAVAETSPPVLAQRRCVRHLVGQLQPQIPARGRIAFHLAHQLPLAADSEQIADEQQLEQHHRIQRWSPVVLAIQVSHSRSDELQINGGFDLPQHMIAGHQPLDRHQFHLLLPHLRLFQHAP